MGPEILLFAAKGIGALNQDALGDAMERRIREITGIKKRENEAMNLFFAVMARNGKTGSTPI